METLVEGVRAAPVVAQHLVDQLGEGAQPDGGRALVVGKLDKVPDVAGGLALQIVVCDARVTALEAK